MAEDENRPIGSIKALYGALEKWAPQISKLAPSPRFDIQRFTAVVMSCASRTPRLLLCSYYSIRQAVQAGAELGLELGGVSGEAFLIPYENRKKIEYPDGRYEWISVLEAQFMPGYKGYLRLMHESGLFRDLGCDVILPDDTWEPVRRGPEKLQWGHVQGEPKAHPALKIKASYYDKERKGRFEYDAEIEPLRGAYAYAKLADERSDDVVKVIWFPRLEQIRARSKAGQDGPWITDYHEMAKKTAVRNLWKYVPRTARMARAEELDQEFDFESVNRDGREPRVPEVITVEPPTKAEAAKAKTDRVAEKVAAKAKPAAAPPPPPSSRPESEPPNHDGDDADGPDYGGDGA